MEMGRWTPFFDYQRQRLRKKSILNCLEGISFYNVRMMCEPTFCYPFSEVVMNVTRYERAPPDMPKMAKMFDFKDLFPRVFAVFTEDVESNDSEKKLLQKLCSCQQDMGTIRDFFRKPVGLKRKAPSTPKAGQAKPVSEKEMNVLLASNVLKKVIDADIIMNTAHPKPTDPRDQFFKYPHEAKMDGLYIGNSKAWYGELDMVIVPEKGSTSDVGNFLVVTESSEEAAENLKQSPGDRTAVEGNVGPEKDSSVTGSTKSLSQSYAVTVTFSQVYHLRHPERKLFPSIQISPYWFKVLIYDVEKDVMVAQSFQWCSGSFLVLWAVVNYYHFLEKEIPKEGMRFVGSHRLKDECLGFEEADILHYMEAKGNVVLCEDSESCGALLPVFNFVD